MNYGLESHLKTRCEENKDFEELYFIWNSNKKNIKNKLKYVVSSYPHYSLHDESHSKTIISNIEMLLGEERIKKLSPTDTWLLLSSAYLHDIGMILIYNQIENNWETEEFQEFLKELENSFDSKMSEAVLYIKKLKENLKEKTFEKKWPIKIKKYVTFIVAEFYRRKHSNMSREYIKNMRAIFDIDLRNSGTMKVRLIDLIATVSAMHTSNSDEILKLDYKTNGHAFDYVHPRFVAEMIRMGDLLDADNGRFDYGVENIIGERPDISEYHNGKHEATTHILITPKTIEYRADCPNKQVYRETKKFIKWLEEEIKFLALNWTNIVPSEFIGGAPVLTKKEVLLKGKPDIEGTAELKFEISQEKAFDIVEGMNLYNDNLIFLREILQNAYDATRVQIWKDIKLGLYPIPEDKVNKDMMPYDIDDILTNVFSKYPITVEINDVNKNEIEVVITDRGTGISKEVFQQMCHVGESYHLTKERKKKIEEMPLWLRPTGGFGIGLQSVFAVTSSFEIYTCTNSQEKLYAVLFSNKTNSYIELEDMEDVEELKDIKETIRRGTAIKIQFDKRLIKDENLFENVRVVRPIEFKSTTGAMSFDRLLIKHTLEAYNLLCVIEGINIYSPFAIEYFLNGKNFSNNKINEDKVIFYNIGKLKKESENIIYSLSNNLDEINLWNKLDGIYVSIRFKPSEELLYFNRHDNGNVCFKDIILTNTFLFFDMNIKLVHLSIYGKNTKEYITLDRNSLITRVEEKINIFIGKVIKLFSEEIYNYAINDSERFQSFLKSDIHNIINFLTILDNKYIESLLHLDIIKNTLKTVKLYVISVNDFIKKDYPLYELLIDLENILILDNLDIDNKKDIEYLKQISSERLPKSKIIVDKHFIGRYNGYIQKYIIDYLLKNHYINKIFIFNNVGYEDEDVYKAIILYQLTRIENHILLNTDEETKSAILLSLLSENDIRTAIPAMKEYKKLVVIKNTVAYLIYKIPRIYSIISPFSSSDMEYIEKMKSKQELVQYTMQREEFRILVNYVYENQVEKYRIEKSEIEQEYKKLIEDYYDVAVKDDPKENT